MIEAPYTVDPLEFLSVMWPDIRLYDREREIVRSVQVNDETVVVAGNKLGKDFITSIIVLWFFLSRQPCRIVVTSAKEDHLRVLFGEIGERVRTAKYPLNRAKGGPLVCKYQDIRKVVNGEVCPISYVVGMVASQDSIASLQGHHVASPDALPRTMFVADEASSVRDNYFTMAASWATRTIIIGNAWPTTNRFRTHVKEGDLRAHDYVPPSPGNLGNLHHYRKVIRIQASESPNVRLALAELRAGKQPSGDILVPGVKTYAEYIKDRATLSPAEQSVILDASFWEGADQLIFPSEWLDACAHFAEQLDPGRPGAALGIDPGEGSANTTSTVVDRQGIIDMRSRRTPDTSVIADEAIAMYHEYGIPPGKIGIDRGGGGKQIADEIRRRGYKVQTIGFGEGILHDLRRGTSRRQYDEQVDTREERYAYKNRRAEMFCGELRNLIRSGLFGLPLRHKHPRTQEALAELHRQLSLMPLLFDQEGRMVMLPKNPRPNSTNPNELTLIKLLGHSPDEADSLAVAVHTMLHVPATARAGAVGRV